MRGSEYKDKEGTKPWNGKSYDVERLTLIGGMLMRGFTVHAFFINKNNSIRTLSLKCRPKC